MENTNLLDLVAGGMAIILPMWMLDVHKVWLLNSGMGRRDCGKILVHGMASSDAVLESRFGGAAALMPVGAVSVLHHRASSAFSMARF